MRPSSIVHKYALTDYHISLCLFFQTPSFTVRRVDLLTAFVDSSVGHRCEFCLKLYATRRILEIHISTVHLKQRPYPCGICHQTFTQRGTLNRHLRIHTGERFQCIDCGRSYTQKFGLHMHRMRGLCPGKITSSQQSSLI